MSWSLTTVVRCNWSDIASRQCNKVHDKSMTAFCRTNTKRHLENSIFSIAVPDADKHSTCVQVIMNYLHCHCLASHCPLFLSKSIENRENNGIRYLDRDLCACLHLVALIIVISQHWALLMAFYFREGGQRKKVFVYFCFAHFAFAHMGIFGIHTCMHGLLQALMMESF